jgi:hypothetical protein
VAGVTRLSVAAAALVAGVLVVGAALAAHGEPKLAFTAADQAHAKVVLLKKAELPGKGWKAAKVDFARANPDCLVKHYSLAKLTSTGQAGIEFTREVDTGTFLVDSIARIFRTSTQAATAVKIRSQLGVGKCLGSTLVSEAPFGSKASSTTKAFSLGGLALPAKGFKIVVKVTMGQQKYTLTGAVLEFRHARTVNELSVLTIDKGWSSGSFRTVASVLAKRTAKA